MGSRHWIPFPRTVRVTGIVAPLFSSSPPFVCFIFLAVSIGGWAGVNNLSAVVSVVAMSSPLLQVPSEFEGLIHHHKMDVCTLLLLRELSSLFPTLPHSTFLFCGHCLPLQSGGSGSPATWVGSTLMTLTIPSPQLFMLKVKHPQRPTFLHCILWSFKQMEQENNPVTPRSCFHLVLRLVDRILSGGR